MLTDITSLETSYLGKTVKVSETDAPIDPIMSSETVKEYTLDETDPVIVQLVADAKQLGLDVWFWLPDTIGIMNYDTSRLKVYIEKKDDTYTIARMEIG